jgi:carboxylesterase type B
MLKATGRYYNFSNIRYAAPPTGNNRWRVPQPPEVDRSTVQNGSIGRICPQANPIWTAVQTDFVQKYLLGKPYNASTYTAVKSNQTLLSRIPKQDPRTTEDCLFLDVFVPEDVFQNDGNRKLAPVLVWIYGRLNPGLFHYI